MPTLDYATADAASTDLTYLLGDCNPYAPDLDPTDLTLAMDYLIECIGQENNRAVASEATFQLCELAYTLRGPLLDLPPVASANPWQEVKDGDPRLLMLFCDHYSHRPARRQRNLIIGPGYKLALIVPHATDPQHGRPQAIFAWRLERYRRDQDYGANCAFFRNESPLRASALLLAAEEHARRRWPYIPRFFTLIDTTKVKPTWRRGAPVWGYSYIKAGWEVLPQRTQRGLLRLEKTFTPLGWLDAWSTGTTVTACPECNEGTDWPFPVRYRQRDPRAGAQPPWRPYRRQARRAKTKPSPITHQLELLQ
jgi:hypothetical protein